MHLRPPSTSGGALHAGSRRVRYQQRWNVLGRDEHLDTAEAERHERPLGQEPYRLGRDPSSAGGGSDARAELTDPVVAQRDRHLTEVGIARAVGDHEMKQGAFPTPLLVEVRHRGAVARRQGRDPARRGVVLPQLERGVEVVLSKRAQDEVVPANGGSGYGIDRVDRPSYEPAKPSSRWGDDVESPGATFEVNAIEAEMPRPIE